MQEKKEIYLDNSATTPVRKEVLEEAKKYFCEEYGNPSSFHSTGLRAKKAMKKSREKIAKILGASEEEIIFTGSGTESINLAIKGIAFKEIENALKEKRKIKGNFIFSSIEHDAVLETMEWLEKLGFEIKKIGVDEKGFLKIEDLEKAINSNTLLVSIMYANNETGTIEAIKEISKICKTKKALFHTDACQGAEYLELNVKKLGVDMMTINGSKIYSFKGTGALYKRKGLELIPLIHGGGHEKGLRAGTENVAGIVAMAKALELAEKEKKKEKKRLEELRDYFITRVEKEIKKVKVNGDRKKRLPNNANISFYGIEGESLLLLLNEKGIRVSTGSACSSQSLEPSHVLTAMNVPHELAHSSIRFSFGKYTTKKELEYTIKVLKKSVERLRKMSPIWEE
jgi:cysteine desulfurase